MGSVKSFYLSTPILRAHPDMVTIPITMWLPGDGGQKSTVNMDSFKLLPMNPLNTPNAKLTRVPKVQILVVHLLHETLY